MSTPLPAGPMYRAMTIMVPVDPPPTTVDEHFAEVHRILDTDRILDELRDGFAERVSHADHLFAQIKGALRLTFDDGATNDEIAAHACTALQAAWERHDATERLARVEAALARVYSDRPADAQITASDVADAISSALHPLSSRVESATAMMPPVTPRPKPSPAPVPVEDEGEAS